MAEETAVAETQPMAVGARENGPEGVPGGLTQEMFSGGSATDTSGKAGDADDPETDEIETVPPEIDDDSDDDEDGEPAAADPEPAKPAAAKWDKERQRKDQETANRTRHLEGMVETLAAQNERLMAALTQRAEPAAKPEPVIDVAGHLSRADALTAESDPDDLVGTIKGLSKVVQSLLSKPPSDPATQAELKALREQQARDKQEREVEKWTENREKTMTALCSTLSRQYGEQYRNAAMANATAILEARGFTDENRADPVSCDLAIELGWQQAAAGKKPKPRTPGVPADTGRGGTTPVASGGGTGTLKEVLRRMQKEGKLRE